MSEIKKSQATLLVEIAVKAYTFGCVDAVPGYPPSELHTWFAPQFDSEKRRPLADLRPILADEFQLEHGDAPNASALGDAMMVLEGKARSGLRVAADTAEADGLLGLFAATNVATQLVKLAHKAYTFGVTATGEVYAVEKDGPKVARVLRGGRRSLRAELARAHFAETRHAANASALADALLVLEGEAQNKDATDVMLRVGRAGDDLVLDLGKDDGTVVVVNADGWALTTDSPVLFWRTNATLPLPTPQWGGRLDGLRSMLNLSDDDWPLILAYLVAALMPDVPHPVLLLRGEQGTAKSSAARLLTSLIDPCAAQLRAAPRDHSDWAVACAASWVTCLDNVSQIEPWLSDAMCRAVTGAGTVRRQLYTDSDVSVLSIQRALMLTTIDPGRLAGDLAERSLIIELEPIEVGNRVGERALSERWRDIHAETLGALLDLAVEVLRVLPAIRTTGLPRMADFGRVLLALDQVLDTSGYARYEAEASQTAENVIDSDAVGAVIREHWRVPETKTASDLLRWLDTFGPATPPRGWPTTPQAVGARLTRLAPDLRKLGWTVEQEQRTKHARGWFLAPPATEQGPGTTSPSSPSSPTPAEQGKRGDDPDDEGRHQADEGRHPHATGDRGDDLGGPGDNPGDEGRHPIAAGHDVGDNGDDLPGSSSVLPQGEDPPVEINFDDLPDPPS